MSFLCLEHSLICHVHEQDNEPQSKKCTGWKACSYVILKDGVSNTIKRGCKSNDNEPQVGKCVNATDITICACDTDNCNNYCSVDKCTIKGPVETQTETECVANCKATGGGPETNDTTPTDATTTNKRKTNSIDDNSLSTNEDGPQPTEEGTGATGEDSPQPTEDRSGDTAEDAEETQKPTGKASANSGNLRVVESNQFVFAILILANLIIRSFYQKTNCYDRVV